MSSGLPLMFNQDFEVFDLVVDPSQAATVYAGTIDGIFKSTDGGNNWTSVDGASAFKVVIDPSPSTTLYAACSGDLLKSTDGGASWISIGAGLFRSEGSQFAFNVYDVAIDPTNTANLYATTRNGIFRSGDAGATWTAASCGLPSVPLENPSYDLPALAIDPRNPGTIYAGGAGVFKSVDGGTTWNALGTALSGTFVQALSFDTRSSTLYAATEGMGLSVFTDTGLPGPPSSVLCIDGEPGDARFTIRVHFQTQQSGGLSGDGRPILLAGVGVDHGGLFWFFDAGNPEMLVKVINGCAVDQKFWLFYSAGTNVGLTTTVVDNATGESKTYSNADLTAAPPVQDTAAFDCLTTDRAAQDRGDLAVAPAPPAAAAVGCSPGAETLCIDERFRVEVAYKTTQDGGQSGMGQAIALDSVGVNQGGLFWFFSPDNPEMLIKVIDACAVDGKYWVFYSAGTNVGLKVTVTDTRTGKSATYTNPDLTAAPPVQDTSALPCG